MRPTILFINETSHIGGGEINLLLLIKLLKERGFNIAVILPNSGELVDALDRIDIQVYLISGVPNFSASFYVGRRKIPNPIALIINLIKGIVWGNRLRRKIINIKPDIVQTMSLWAHAFGGWAAKWSNVPNVAHFQDVVEENSGFGFYRLFVSLWAQIIPDHIVCISPIVADQFQKIHRKNSQVSLILNTVDVEKFFPSDVKNNLNSKLIIATVGRLTPWKGQHIALNVAYLLKQEDVLFKWRFVGEATLGSERYLSSLNKIVKNYRLEDDVEFCGWIDDMAAFYRSIDVLVHLPTEPEPFGLVITEAMASGVPVITVSGGGAEEIVRDGGGVIIDDGQIVEGVKFLKRWAINKDELIDRKNIARTYASSQFSLGNFAEQWVNVYNQMILKKE